MGVRIGRWGDMRISKTIHVDSPLIFASFTATAHVEPAILFMTYLHDNLLDK